MQTLVVSFDSPNVPTYDTATPYTGVPGTVTPGLQTINIPVGATQVTLLNRGSASASYEVDGKSTAISTAAITSGEAGAGYAVGDIVNVVQPGAFDGQVEVTAATGGVPSAIQIVEGGIGYSVANGLSTTGGSGAGLEISVTAVDTLTLAAGGRAVIALNGNKTLSLQGLNLVVDATFAVANQ